MGALAAVACTRGTNLAPTDRALIVGAERATAFIVTRQDGGMPSADRALAESACTNLAKVLVDAKLDAGPPCP